MTDTNSNQNQNQNIITAVSIIVALIAVAYALMSGGSIENKAEQAMRTFEVGDNNPVVMTIEGRDVTRMEILDNFNKSNSKLPQGADLSQIFPLMQQQYLIGELLIEKAKEKGIDESNPQVALRMKEAKDLALRAEYISQIGEEGLSDDDLQQAYDDIIGNAESVIERKARHILVEDLETANALLIKANQTKDFAKLAEDNSTGPSAQKGGDLGYFAKDEMVPEFAEAVFSMDIGDVSKRAVKTQFGYHIIKLEDERVRPKPTLNDIRDQLADQLKKGIVSEKIAELTNNVDVVLFDMNGNPMTVAEQPVEPLPVETEGETESE